MMSPSDARSATAPPPSGNGVRRFVFSRDHKVIGLQYWFLALLAVGVGLLLSLLMRVQLAFPDADLSVLERFLPLGLAGGVLSPEFYLSMVTMHGTLMVFFVLTTAPMGAFGNFMLPLQIGARNTAFPGVGRLSFWLTFVAFLVILAAFFVEGGAPLGGWTAYPPLSALGEIVSPGQGAGMNLWIVSIALFCVGALLGAGNLLVTTLTLRAPGMSLMRLPLTCWGWFVTSVLTLLSFPVLLAAGVLLMLDRNASTSFFLPSNLVVSGEMLDHRGGSPILWQHLFWYFGHPEVYIAILPGMGVTSQILSTFARKPIFGYRAMVFSTFAIGLLGFLVWGHHMFTSGLSPYAAVVFSLVTLAVGVPSALKTVNWIGTLYRGRIRFTTAMLFALGFVSLFVSGGLGGIFLGQTSVDLFLHDTYFVVGHFHLIMGAAALFAIFSATYYWFPKMFGRLMNEPLGRLHFFMTFIGVFLIFVPMHALGIVGAPRRYYDSSDYEFLGSILSLNSLISWAAFLTAAAQLLFVFNLLWSRWRGCRAGNNPWDATTLEWTTASPPPSENFPVPLVVSHGPYEYGVPGAAGDAILQSDAPTAIDDATGEESRVADPDHSRTWSVGIGILLIPILMLFVAFASASIVRQGMGEAWTPVPLPTWLWIDTVVLLLSGLAVEVGVRSASASRRWLWGAVAGAVLFLLGQAMAWKNLLEQGNVISASPHASFFYVLTAAHAMQVLAGMLGLMIVATWPPAGRWGLQPATGRRLAAVVWHFTVALWLGIVVLLVVGG